MDELAKYNKSRWEALAQARVEFSRPFLEFTTADAAEWLRDKPFFDMSGIGDIVGKEILCLAAGGGQQSAVFGLLGAQVTVLDLTETQLKRDQEAAAHHRYALTAVAGDMRDLSAFADSSFDVVWHPFSINFVPEADKVIREVGRVIRPGGYYNLDFANPFWSMDENQWLPQGYPIKQPYVNGSRLSYTAANWQFTDDQGNEHDIEGPHEFMHTLSTIVNTLVQSGFVILGLTEWPVGDPEAEPGSWDHMLTIVPPFFTIAAIYRQDAFRK